METNRGLVSQRGDDYGELELNKLTQHSKKKSLDTRATENNYKNQPDEEDSLVEDDSSSIFENSF